MAIDNVVPIDAQTARILEQRKIHFRWFVAAVTGVWLAVLVPVLAFTPLPPLVPFVVLALLVILAEHQFVLFGDETSMSASIIVVVASIFVFADTAPLAGPMLIASLGGLYLPHLRQRATRSLVLANAAIFSVAASIAGAITTGLSPSGTHALIAATTASLVATASYWYANSVLVGIASSVRSGSELAQTVRTQAMSEWPVLLLAAASALVAQADDHALVLTACTVAGLLVVFHVHMRRHEQRRSATDPLTVGMMALTIGAASTLITAGPVGVAFACVCVFYVISIFPEYFPRRERGLVPFAVSIAATIVAVALATSGAPVLVRFGATSTLAIALLTILHAQRRLAVVDRHLPLLVKAGLAIPNRSELALLCIAYGGFGAALVGLDGGARWVIALITVTLVWRWHYALTETRRSELEPISFRRTAADASH